MRRLSHRWGLRFIYFFYLGGLGFFLPYLTVFLKDQGLSGTQIGLVLTISSFLSIILVPQFSRNRLVKQYLVFFLQFLLLFAGGMTLCLRLNSSMFFLTIIISLFTLANAFIEPLFGTLFVRVSESYKNLGFGGIRNWGSLGWSITAIAAGFIIMKTGYISLFYILVFSLVITAAILFLFRSLTPKFSPEGSDKKASEGIREILKHKELAVITMVFFIESIAIGMPKRFEGVYLIQLGGTAALIGIMSSLTALLEIPFMILADLALKKITGLALLKIRIFLGFLSALVILLFPHPYVIVATSVFVALSYSIFMVIQIEFAREYSDKDGFTAVLALFQVSIIQMAGLVSSPIAGILFDRAGPWSLYLAHVLLSSLAFIVLILFFKINKESHKK